MSLSGLSHPPRFFVVFRYCWTCPPPEYAWCFWYGHQPTNSKWWRNNLYVHARISIAYFIIMFVVFLSLPDVSYRIVKIFYFLFSCAFGFVCLFSVKVLLSWLYNITGLVFIHGIFFPAFICSNRWYTHTVLNHPLKIPVCISKLCINLCLRNM